MYSSETWLTGLGNPGGPGADVLIRDGVVAAHGQRPAGAGNVFDAGGALALPALIDAHVHPDKSMHAQPWFSRPPAETLREMIDAEVRGRGAIRGSVHERARGLLRDLARSGARAVRAHVDVAPSEGLAGIHGVREAARELEGVLEVQIVAFPQQGVLAAPGTAELIEAALDEGADLIGGLDPLGIDGDLDGQLSILFDMAGRKLAPLDIHLHDSGAEAVREIEEIAARTLAAGMAGQVTLSHAFCLGECDRDTLLRLGDLLAQADIAVTTCALGDCPVVPFEALRSRGVRVGLGSDGVRDTWTPFGTGDMVDRVHLLGYRTGARTDEQLERCWDIGAHGGADVLGLPRAGLAVGDRADLVLVHGAGTAQVVVDRPGGRRVLHGGVPLPAELEQQGANA